MPGDAQRVAVVIDSDVRNLRKGMAEASSRTRKFSGEQTAASRKHNAELRTQAAEERKLARTKEQAARRAIRAAERETRQRAQLARQAHQQHMAMVQRQRGQAAGMMRGGMGGLGGMVGTALGTAGVVGFQQMAQDVLDFESTLTDIMITGNKSNAWLAKTRDLTLSVSDATGKSKTEVASYLSTIVTATGDADFAVDTLRQMGDVAVATGANMADLAGVMVKLGGSMRLSAKDSKAAMNILRAQEKQGTVTMANIASIFGRVASIAPSFGGAGQGLEGTKALGGLLQISARGFSKDETAQSATSSAQFLNFLAMRREKIEKAFGVKLGTGKGKNFKWNNLTDVFKTLSSAFANKSEVFTQQGTKLFGETGLKTARQLQAVGMTGWNKASGKFAAASSIFNVGKEDVIASDLKKRQASDSFKYQQAMTQLSNVFQRKALPVVQAMVKHLPKMLKMVKFILDHSEMLIKLWIGYKGMQFFRNLIGGSRQAQGGAGLAFAQQGYGPGFGQPAGGRFSRLGSAMSRGAPMLGAGMAAASMKYADFGLGPKWGNDAANLAMMSGSPYGMLAGGLYKGMQGAAALTTNLGGGKDTGFASKAFAAMWNPFLMSSMRDESSQAGLGNAADMAAKKILGLANSFDNASMSLNKFFNDTEAGAKLKKDVEGQSSRYMTGEGKKEVFNIGQLLAERGRSGAGKYRDQVGSLYQTLYGATRSRMNPELFRGLSREQQDKLVEEQSPELVKLRNIRDTIDKRLAEFVKNGQMKFNVNAVVSFQNNPGLRSSISSGEWKNRADLEEGPVPNPVIGTQ